MYVCFECMCVNICVRGRSCVHACARFVCVSVHSVINLCDHALDAASGEGDFVHEASKNIGVI